MKPPILQKIHIHRFRSIRDASVEFDNPTFLVGRNGAGKSNILDALALLSESMVMPVRSAIEYRGGFGSIANQTPQPIPSPADKVRASSFGFDLELGRLNDEIESARYTAQLYSGSRHIFEVGHESCAVRRQGGGSYHFDRDAARFTSDVVGLNPAVEPAALLLPVIGGDKRFAPVMRALSRMRSYQLHAGTLRIPRDSGGGPWLRCDGNNFAAVFEEITRSSPESLNRMTEFVRQILPGVTKISPIDTADGWAVEIEQRAKGNQSLKFNAIALSDGTLRALALLAAAFQPDPPSVMAIEEPETSLHPGALGVILDIIRHAATRMQVVVTTHSPELLDTKWIGEQHLRVVSWEDGATRIGRPSEAAREALRDHLMGAGELLRSNALDDSRDESDQEETPIDLSVNAE